MKTTFLFKKKNPAYVIRDGASQVITSDGVPRVVNTPAKVIRIKGGKLETYDQEIIDRLRKDPKFGTSEITEITEEDREAIGIRNKKSKEAESEIAKKKKSRKKVK